ncbi:hypothetical protein JCM5296_001580 [Sporobolomyces johnsonii]
MADRAAGPNKSAWAVLWRNHQARKNKSWESDGYLLVEGSSAKFYDAEGHLLVQRNLTKPPVVDEELKFAQKELQIQGPISLSDFYKAVHPSSDSATPSRATSAPVARPGYLTRPGVSPAAFHSPAPSRSNSGNSAAAPASLVKPKPEPEADDDYGTPAPDTPASAPKKWVMPGNKVQKAFKPPTPMSARLRTPGSPAGKNPPQTLESPARAATGYKSGGSGLKREVLGEVKSRAGTLKEADKGKGKAKAEKDDDEDEGHEEGVENSPPSSKQNEDMPSPPKRRKLDPASATSTSPGAVSKSTSTRGARQSAADAALARSMSLDQPRKSTSALKDHAKITAASLSAPRRSISSPGTGPGNESADSLASRVKPEPLDDEYDSMVLDTTEMEDELRALEQPAEGAFDAGEGETRTREMLARDKGAKGKGKVKEEEDAEKVEPRVVSKTRYFSCQWRKHTNKKHPVWEGDGILITSKNGKASLIDKERGKELSTGTVPNKAPLEEGDILRIGSMDVELGDEVDEQDYLAAAPRSSYQPTTSSTSKPFVPPGSARVSTPLSSRQLVKQPSPSLLNANAKAKPAAVTSLSFFLPQAVVPPAPKVNWETPAPRHDPDKEGAVVMRKPDADHEKIYNKKRLPVVDVVLDPVLSDKLRDHQKEGVKFMYECVMGMRTAGQGCILADDMGLGKTIQSIALIWTLLKQTPYFGGGGGPGVIERAMIVCPVTLVKNWSSEIKKWLGRDRLRVFVADGTNNIKTFATNKSYNVLIVGYEKLRSAIDDVKYAQPPIGLIICDEGHRLKSTNTQITKALQTLSCMRRVILSGTPIQNNLGEFFAMMDFVNPGLLRDASYFKKNYEVPIMKSRDPNAPPKDKAAGEDAADSLNEIQRNFVLRRTSDITQKHLPKKLEYTVFIVPTKLEIALYAEVLSGSAVHSLLNGTGGKDQLSLLMLLRKCSNSPGLLMEQAEREEQEGKNDGILSENVKGLFPSDIYPHDFSLSGKLSVLGALLAELRENSDEKIVIVSNFTQTLEIIEKHCKKLRYPYCRLDGKTPPSDRIPMVDGFNKGSPKNHFIFLLSSKSGGTGLNIIGASRLVLVDSDWNPSTDLQAMARIHRDGQTRECVIYRFLTAGTIDEKIFQRQVTKLALSGSVMDTDQTGGASKKGDAFTLDDLRNIFTLHDATGCQTHDLLDCRCHTGDVTPEDDGADDEPGDSDDDIGSGTGDELGGFVRASQWDGAADESKNKASKARRNLSILRTWQHYDCSSEAAIDSIDDALLRSLVYNRAANAAEHERVLPEPETGPGRRDERMLVRGGQVGFVFGKKTG